MASVGPQSPATAVNQGINSNPWIDPTNVFSSNDARATCALVGFPTGGAFTDALDITNYDFSAIPNDATIDGFTVSIERSVTSTSGSPRDSVVSLLGLTGTSDNKATATTWPTTDASVDYGGAADKWGFATPSVSQVKASTFGVSIRAKVNTGEGISTTARIDHVPITITYTAGGGGGGVAKKSVIVSQAINRASRW